MSAVSQPVGPYTPIVRAGGFLYLAGQLGMRDGALVDGGVAAQTTQAMANAAALLASKGAGLEHVVKTTVFLADINDFATMNEAYLGALGDLRPARSAFQVAALPFGGRVEIECIAFAPEG